MDCECFNIHRTLACNASPFLAQKIREIVENPKTTAARTVGLITVHLEERWPIFRHFARWLYTGTLCEPDPPIEEQIKELCATHALACRFQCLAFEDSVMDGLIDILRGPLEIDVSAFEQWSESFSPGARGVQLAIDFLVHASPTKLVCDDGYFVEWLNDAFDEDALLKIVAGMLEKRSTTEGDDSVPPYISDPCRYHRHSELGLPCYKAQ